MVTVEAYQPGRWSIRYTSDTPAQCRISVNDTLVAQLTDPTLRLTSCVFDSSWVSSN